MLFFLLRLNSFQKGVIERGIEKSNVVKGMKEPYKTREIDKCEDIARTDLVRAIEAVEAIPREIRLKSVINNLLYEKICEARTLLKK